MFMRLLSGCILGSPCSFSAGQGRGQKLHEIFNRVLGTHIIVIQCLVLSIKVNVLYGTSGASHLIL